MVAARLTSVSGASGAFKYGAVTYCNEAKNVLLGVSTETLDEHGAISAETAKEMAEGIRKVMNADIGVSVTGNAGPGAAENKPLGLVFIGVSSEIIPPCSKTILQATEFPSVSRPPMRRFCLPFPPRKNFKED